MSRSPWLEPVRNQGWADRRREKDEERRASEARFLTDLATSIGLGLDQLEELRETDEHFWHILGVAARGYPDDVLNYYAAEVVWFSMVEQQKREEAQKQALGWLDQARRIVYSR